MLFLFKDISYTLGPTSNRSITVSGIVKNGETLIIRGPSGAGKSTLLRILSRLQPCNSGEAYLNNRSWSKIPATQWRTEVHYLPQRPTMFDGTVGQNLAIPFEVETCKNRKAFDINSAKRIMNDLLLSPNILNQNSKTLSGGELARIAFTRTLLIEPSVLLLDEPSAALDGKARDAFYQVLSQWLKNEGRAALLISHNDDYAVLNNLNYLDINKET